MSQSNNTVIPMLPKATNKELLHAEKLRAEQWGKSDKPIAVKRDKPQLSITTRTQNLLEELALKRNDHEQIG